MSAVICERVVRDTAPGGSEKGGNGRSSENMFEDENEDEDEDEEGGIRCVPLPWASNCTIAKTARAVHFCYNGFDPQ